MTRSDVVKMAKQMNVTELSGDKVMIDFETGKYYMIKGVGNDIWEMLQQQEITVEDIINRLLEEYDVSEEECEKSVLDFLNNLHKAGIVS